MADQQKKQLAANTNVPALPIGTDSDNEEATIDLMELM